MENKFNGLSVDSAQLRKESVNLKRGQQKLPKLKHKKTEKKKCQNMQELWANLNGHKSMSLESQEKRV